MPTQLVPNGIEVVFNATQNSIPIVNVYHVKTPGAVDDAALLDVAEVFEAWWQAEMQASLHTSYVLNTIVATDMSVVGGHQVTITLVTDNTGLAGDDAAAANAAAVMSWRTASIGRSYRGRTYIGGMPQAVLLNAQALQTSVAATYAGAGAALIDALETAGFVLAVLSRFAAGVLRVTGLLTQIVEVIVDTKIDSQRRRTAN